MIEARSRTIGLRTGLIILAVVAALGLYTALRPAGLAVTAPTAPRPALDTLDQRLGDAETLAYLNRLQAVSPGGFASLEAEAARLIRADATDEALSKLVLQSILLEMKRGAGNFKLAPTDHYDRIISHAGSAFERLQDEQSVWCNGPRLAAYLEQDEQTLIPSLLAIYPYESESYDWAMRFGVLGLNAIEAGRQTPERRPRPSSFDKAWLQRNGMALGSEQWALGMQIMVFSQSEGQGYAQMQTAIEGIDACQLGLAAVQVSDSLPEAIRATIWADLLPELFHGNMSYVIWRVNDYFFLD